MFRLSLGLFFWSGTLSAPSTAQRRAKTIDDCITYERDFLQTFYPELSGKRYAITFEWAERFDQPTPEADKLFLVDVGDGANYTVLMCCFGGTLGGGVIGTAPAPPAPHDKDLGLLQPPTAAPRAPLPRLRQEKPLNVDPEGAVHPYQYLSSQFVFDSQGNLKMFAWRRKPSKAEMEFSDKVVEHPDMSDEELIAAYKKLSAKYDIGDRKAIERDLPIGKLELFLGRLKKLRTEFDETTNKRLDRLGAFNTCTVFLKNEENGTSREYKAVFESERGELIELSVITDKK